MQGALHASDGSGQAAGTGHRTDRGHRQGEAGKGAAAGAGRTGLADRPLQPGRGSDADPAVCGEGAAVGPLCADDS